MDSEKLARYYHPDWAMLDVYLRPLLDGGDTSALAYASTGSGGKIGVHLVTAPPPRTSYILYQWIPDEGRHGRGGSSHEPTTIHHCWDAKAVAAHGNSILLRFLFPTSTFPGKSEEFFIYQADLPRRSTRLTKLPTCHQNHTFMNSNTKMNTGILCRQNGEEFVVAHLTVLPDGARRHCRVTAELCCFFGNKGSWRPTERLPISCDEAEQKHLAWWKTDAVLPFGDFICWVDYLRGILLCDVFSPHPVVRYVPLPISPYHGNCHPDLRGRGALATCRGVSVTNTGAGIKFVDIAHGDAWFYGGHGVPRLPSHISSWKLTEDYLWVEDGMVSDKEFFDLASLPSSLLECPLVDLIDPDTIYFVLGDDEQDEDEEEEQKLQDPYSQSCLIAVHMKSRTVDMIPCDIRSFGSSDMYHNTTSCNLYYHESFLPLNLDAKH